MYPVRAKSDRSSPSSISASPPPGRSHTESPQSSRSSEANAPGLLKFRSVVTGFISSASQAWKRRHPANVFRGRNEYRRRAEVRDPYARAQRNHVRCQFREGVFPECGAHCEDGGNAGNRPQGRPVKETGVFEAVRELSVPARVLSRGDPPRNPGGGLSGYCPVSVLRPGPSAIAFKKWSVRSSRVSSASPPGRLFMFSAVVIAASATPGRSQAPGGSPASRIRSGRSGRRSSLCVLPSGRMMRYSSASRLAMNGFGPTIEKRMRRQGGNPGRPPRGPEF